MNPDWRSIQRNNFRSLSKLLSYLEIEKPLKDFQKNSSFPLNLPERLAKKIAKNTLDDPILQQFLPFEEESIVKEGFVENPTEDPSFCITPKLLQKYEGRALLITTSACAMHCRYCFRQNFPYEEKTDFSEEIQKIAEDPSIFEVILSGGDPLSLSNYSLQTLLEKLNQIKHVRIIRFHTRFVIGIPERIDTSFLQMLKRLQKQVIFVIHCNHPRELDADIFRYLKKISALSIPLLCQSVLLQGVNDNLPTLVELCQKLVEGGIIPYYLHQLDPVKGSHPFFVKKEKGLSLIKKLQSKVPGYAVFRYVQEIPGKKNKTPLHSIDGLNP